MRIFSNDPNFVFYIANYEEKDAIEATKAANLITGKLKELRYFKFQQVFTNLQAMINYAKAL